MGEDRTSRQTAALRGAQQGGVALAPQPGFGWLARAGFVARGVLYGVIGILAIKLAAGAEGRITNQQGALRTIAQQSSGKVLLIVVAAGLGAMPPGAWSVPRSGPAARKTTALLTVWRRSPAGSSTPGSA